MFTSGEKRLFLIMVLLIPVIALIAMPVAGFWKFNVLERQPQETKLRLIGWKFLDCTYVHGSEVPYVRLEQRGPWYEGLGFHYEKDPYPDSSRPPGYHSFGIWVWNHDYKPYSVKVRVEHDCFGYLKTTTAGPFVLGDRDEQTQ